MDYRGKIINITPDASQPAAEYICTYHDETHVEFVPLMPQVAGHLEFPRVPLKGPHSGKIVGVRNDDALIESTMRDYEITLLLWESGDREPDFMNVILGKDDTTCVRNNLERLRTLNLTKEECAQCEPDYRKGKSDVFAEIYGGAKLGGFEVKARIQDEVQIGPKDTKLTGQVLFIESKVDPMLYGEFIVVQETDKSLFGVLAVVCSTGNIVRKLNRADINILSVNDDPVFICQFIDRLEDMSTPQYSAVDCDAAETVVAQLRRLPVVCSLNFDGDEITFAPGRTDCDCPVCEEAEDFGFPFDTLDFGSMSVPDFMRPKARV